MTRRDDIADDYLDTAEVHSARITELERLESRIATIADESSGPHPVQSADDSLTAIERTLFEQRARIEAARKLADEWDAYARRYPAPSAMKNVECSSELRAALQNSTGSAGTGAGNHPEAAPSGSDDTRPAQPVDSLPGLADAAVARVAEAVRRAQRTAAAYHPASEVALRALGDELTASRPASSQAPQPEKPKA